MIVGHIDLDKDPGAEHWYELSDGTIVSFHTAFLNKERTESVMFVSDNKTWPSITANELGYRYTFMRNSTREEIGEFMQEANISFALDINHEEEE